MERGAELVAEQRGRAVRTQADGDRAGEAGSEAFAVGEGRNGSDLEVGVSQAAAGCEQLDRFAQGQPGGDVVYHGPAGGEGDGFDADRGGVLLGNTIEDG